CVDIDDSICDCFGNIKDCNGNCGGNAVEDECGVCGGTGSTCLSTISQLIPDQFNLFQNYPNPFNSATQIRYNIPEYSKVSLKIFDITGREIAVLYNGYKYPGRYTLFWNASKFVSGLYFLEINVTSSNNAIIFRDIKKILYIQ
ncbi:uncharacterized protein METZ01_LOCUS335713, partial [marine metagenome]